jgi:hypothetical protein
LRRLPNASASLIQSGVFGSTSCDIAHAVSREWLAYSRSPAASRASALVE